MDHVEADYLVVGAGAVGMAFADTMLSDSGATIAIVDRNHGPGGHWNDAYPFVRLHQPSAGYGVNSRPLGSGRIDDHELNKGMRELATGAELVSYYQAVMRERFLPSGRVQYFPLSSYTDGSIVSTMSGRSVPVRARKIVDATLNKTSVPSRHARNFAVAPGMVVIAPNELPGRVRPDARYVIIGAGKTGMDTGCWLLEHEVDPERVSWIVPRDSWVLDRANFQLGREFLDRFRQAGAAQTEALKSAASIPDLFARLEACGQWRRVDPKVTPTAYHCATLSDGELRLLRQLQNVVRMGRVTAIEENRIVLEQGSVPTGADVIHIDCTAAGIPPLPDLPVFEGDAIRLLWVRQCQPVFSGAFIAHIEATVADEAHKNFLCAPIPSPQEPLDWLRMVALDFVNRRRWAAEPGLADWLATIRLDCFSGQARALPPEDRPSPAERERQAADVAVAEKRALELLAGA